MFNLLVILLYVSDIFYFDPFHYNSGLILPAGILVLFGLLLVIMRYTRKNKQL